MRGAPVILYYIILYYISGLLVIFIIVSSSCVSCVVSIIIIRARDRPGGLGHISEALAEGRAGSLGCGQMGSTLMGPLQ